MLLSDYDYHLPAELIAQYPVEHRDASRLLVVDPAQQTLCDQQFTDLPAYLQSGDVLVLNDTRVIPARLFGHKATGGRVELLIERVISGSLLLAHIKASKSPKPGSFINLPEQQLEVVDKQDGLYQLKFQRPFADEACVIRYLEQQGQIPLPPYIERGVLDSDDERYQTVYSQNKGSVAAPTAGLHFTEALLNHLQDQGVQVVYVTLHVGAGTFQPVRNRIENHVMHSEVYEVTPLACDVINQARLQGRRIVAVGTTVVRTLESAWDRITHQLKPNSSDTRLFIQPGFEFQCVDAVLTNFHLPKSTLLMLVSAFMSHDLMHRAYEHAVEEQYRFFSYGDAMFITAKTIQR